MTGKLRDNETGLYLYGIGGENLGTYTSAFVASPASFTLTLTLAQSRGYFFGKKLFVTEDGVGSAASNGTFYPYGEPKTGSTSEQYGFATYWQDGESGLDYAMNRFYSSTLGRFLSPDPYGGSMNPKSPGSFNRYAYALNDPVDISDPTGLMGLCPPGSHNDGNNNCVPDGGGAPLVPGNGFWWQAVPCWNCEVLFFNPPAGLGGKPTPIDIVGNALKAAAALVAKSKIAPDSS
jgi:RHS repeat-associated protein